MNPIAADGMSTATNYQSAEQIAAVRLASMLVVGTPGSNVTARVLISAGTSQVPSGELSLTATGVIASSKGEIPFLGTSGEVTVTGGTVSSTLGKLIAPTLMGLVP